MNPLHALEGWLTSLLEWLHTTDAFWPGEGGIPWAWAIVATTIIVRTILLPLTVRQIHSMQRLQAHAPEMKAIQQRYKQDRQKQQEELMKFYRENKINPASSCLPILFQIPVFLALFFVLRDFDTEVLPRHGDGDLGWLHIVADITENLNEDVFAMVVLLVLYATSQTTATLLMSTTMDKMQRYLLLALPLIFLFFVVNFPSGLMIYWVTTNLWTTGQGLITRKLRPTPQPPEKKSSRTPPGGGADAQPRATAAAAGSPPRRVKKKKRAKR